MQLSAAPNPVHVQRLVGALDRAHGALDDISPVLDDVAAGTPRNVRRVEEALTTAGTTLASASSHAARSGKLDLVGPLANAASGILALAPDFALPEGARTWPADRGAANVEGARSVQHDVIEMIEQARMSALGQAAPTPTPPREDYAPTPADEAGYSDGPPPEGGDPAPAPNYSTAPAEGHAPQPAQGGEQPVEGGGTPAPDYSTVPPEGYGTEWQLTNAAAGDPAAPAAGG